MTGLLQLLPAVGSPFGSDPPWSRCSVCVVHRPVLCTRGPGCANRAANCAATASAYDGPRAPYLGRSGPEPCRCPGLPCVPDPPRRPRNRRDREDLRRGDVARASSRGLG